LQSQGSSTRRRLWWSAALVVSAGAALWAGARDTSLAFEDLVDATPRAYRAVEPRLSGGFRWAPYRAVAPHTEDAMRFRSATARVLRNGDATATSRHLTAIALLLRGDAQGAETTLRTLASPDTDATRWSDLAAARYVAAVATNDASGLAAALAAADAALAINADLGEARFNRALILDRLGFRDEAASAWRRFLDADGSSDWSTEARERLRVASVPVVPFKEELKRRYEELSRNAAEAQELARRFPQESRVWGETDILGRWADAFEAGDFHEAARHLEFARELGAQLARDHGDRMLIRAVAAIDAASVADRQFLAKGHQAFRDGQSLYKQQRVSDAERALSGAIGPLEAGRSPVALLARYFHANTIYDLGRVDDARAQLLSLMANAPPDFAAYRAQLQWQLGLVYGAGARWGDAIDSLKASITGFERLGEMDYATTVRELLAEVYDFVGDPDSAWQERTEALTVLGRTTSQRLLYVVSSIADAALLRHDWPVAVSFLALQIDIGGCVDDRLVLVEGLLARAMLRRRLNDSAAGADLAEAQQQISRTPDAALRARLEADAWPVEAALSESPARAAEILTRAIDFHQGGAGRRLYLPTLYLQRGRASNAEGDSVQAARDFESGIAELEAHRQSLPDSHERAGVFFRDEELFEEAVALAAIRGDARSALAYAERARARALLDVLGEVPTPVNEGSVPDDTAMVEYVTLPSKVMIFVIDGDGVRLTEVAAPRRRLTELLAQLERAASPRHEDREAFDATSASLHRFLIAPIESQLSSKKAIIFIPDVALDGAPFGALRDDDGAFLIEKHDVLVTPSAAVYARLGTQQRAAAPRRLLIVSNPASSSVDLASAPREAAAVASLYAEPTQLDGADATRSAFIAAAPSADVIHFAGHAIASEGATVNASFLVFAPEGSTENGHADVRAISALRLRRSPVVVLAACSTARGAARGPEGVLSVSRAFLAAGAPTVIATLWPIDDGEAAEFFPRVHAHLARGETPAAALRAAQLEWVHRSDSSRSLWAAVQVMGR
jgi:CHAT domain-containing protein